MALAGLEISLIACSQNRPILQCISLRRGDVADAAVAVLEVVAAHEVASPEAGVFKGGEAAHRVMRSRLKAADAGYTPERALDQLQRIQHHRVRLNGGEPVAGVSTLSTEQSQVLHTLGIGKPAAPEQLALL